jgi:2-polyprenyl-3-methyl-5-hydroxy-6-metoxy-1,4-benzoquinol methylase
MSATYLEKGQAYFNAARYDLLELLPKDPAARVLEIGAGGGDTLLAARAAGVAGEVHGVDITRLPDSHQGHPDITRFLIADVEAENLPYAPETFDAVITADLLEHLRDPWAVMTKLSKLLKPGGLWVASIPNFRHYTVLIPVVLRADFRYQLAGPLDRTHVRFFCKKNIAPLFEQAGLEPIRTAVNRGPYGIRQKTANWLSLRLFDDLFVFQYRVLARKPAVGRG